MTKFETKIFIYIKNNLLKIKFEIFENILSKYLSYHNNFLTIFRYFHSKNVVK